MKELPPILHNAVVDGLTMMLALRLPGTPAADTVAATAAAWSGALAENKVWDEAEDKERFDKAFWMLAASAEKWPLPKDLLKTMPPRREKPKLEHRHRPTQQQKQNAADMVAQMKIRLAAAPCFQTGWIRGTKSRPAHECRRIHAERQQPQPIKGKSNG